MYLFSGEATCLKVIPAGTVMSVNLIFSGCVTSKAGVNHSKPKASTASTEYGLRSKLALPRSVSLVRRRPRFLFQLSGDFELLLTFSVATRRYIGTAQLIVNMRLIRFEPCGLLETWHAVLDVAGLQ